jgi:hypothetical protein
MGLQYPRDPRALVLEICKNTYNKSLQTYMQKVLHFLI